MTTSCSDPPLDDRPPQRTWLTPGDPYTTNDDRARVTAAIAALTWHARTGDLLVPAMAGHAIANAARQLGLPSITHVAFDGTLAYPDGSDTVTYALYGVQCTYARHSPARLYLLDTGTSLVTLAHDTWPTPGRDGEEQHMSTTEEVKAALTVEPQDTDDLVAKTGLTQRDIVEALGVLEIGGAGTVIVEAVPGRRDAGGGKLVRARLAGAAAAAHATRPDPGRVERLHALVERYPGDWTADVDGDTLAGSEPARFALLMNRANARGVNDWWITTHTTLPDALQSAGEDVLFGNAAAGVFDLDTGDVHGVHVEIPVVSNVGGTDAPTAPWDTEPLAPVAPAMAHAQALGILRFVEQTPHHVGAPDSDEHGYALNASGMLDDWLTGRRREHWDGGEGACVDELRAEVATLREDADAAREILRAVALGWAGPLTNRDHEPILSLRNEPWRLSDHGVRTVASLTLQELATALVAEADALRFTSTRFEQGLKTIQHDTSVMCGCGDEAGAALRAGCAHPEMYGELKRDRFRLLEHLEALEAASDVLVAAAGPFTTDPDRDSATRTLHSAAVAVEARISTRKACA